MGNKISASASGWRASQMGGQTDSTSGTKVNNAAHVEKGDGASQMGGQTDATSGTKVNNAAHVEKGDGGGDVKVEQHGTVQKHFHGGRHYRSNLYVFNYKTTIVIGVTIAVTATVAGYAGMKYGEYKAKAKASSVDDPKEPNGGGPNGGGSDSE